MSKVLVNLPFEVKQSELEFWEFMNVLFLKYDDLEDLILWKYIEDWEKTQTIDNDDFKSFLISKIWK